MCEGEDVGGIGSSRPASEVRAEWEGDVEGRTGSQVTWASTTK